MFLSTTIKKAPAVYHEIVHNNLDERLSVIPSKTINSHAIVGQLRYNSCGAISP